MTGRDHDTTFSVMGTGRTGSRVEQGQMNTASIGAKDQKVA